MTYLTPTTCDTTYYNRISYGIVDCPTGCYGCTGGSATQCKECAPGYVKNEDSKACEGEQILAFSCLVIGFFY